MSESAEGLVVPLERGQHDRRHAVGAARHRRQDGDESTCTLGLRDPRTERVQITSGVNEGDILLRGAAQGITPGTPVQVDRAAVA